MKYLKNGIFFVAACIYFYSYNVNGYISSYSNRTLNLFRGQAKNETFTTEFTGGCTLPRKTLYNIDYDITCPKNIFGSYCNHCEEGAPIPQDTKLKYKCKNGFFSYGLEASVSVCLKGAWTPPISQCGKTCSELKPQNVIIKCMYEGKEINCDGKLIANTKVITVSCLPQYTRKNSTSSTESIYCQKNGEWSGALMQCIPRCGHSSPTTITPHIHVGERVFLGEFPWHAAVYEKPNNTLICGATIISPYSLLSAAHCFYDRDNDKQRSPADYEIGVGKITRDRLTNDSESTEFYEVETLIFHNFRGLQLRFQRDIVIIVTKTKISFNSQVSPVCLFKDCTIEIKNNALLRIPGWGVDESGRQTGSPHLEFIQLPYISYDECTKIAPTPMIEYLATEKFCTGLNVSSLDQGDSGGGVVLKNSFDSSYYLVGIVSIRPMQGSFITLHTNVLDYFSWISTKLNEIHVAKNEIFD